MTRLSKSLRMFLRFLAIWAVDAISLLVTAAVLPGMNFAPASVGLSWSWPPRLLCCWGW